MLRIVFVGTGNAFAETGSFFSCHWLLCSSAAPPTPALNYSLNFLWDCGPSSLTAIKKYNLPIADLRYFFISHLHGDHFAGLVFFLLDYAFLHPITDLKDTVKIIGPLGIKERVESLVRVCYPNQADILLKPCEFHELNSRASFKFSHYIMESFPARHNEGALMYKFKPARPELDLLPTVAYSGDNHLSLEQFVFLDNVDYFITECTSLTNSAGNHTTLQMIKSYLPNFEKTNLKKIFLVHLGEDVCSLPASAIPPTIIRTYDGMMFDHDNYFNDEK